MKRVLFFLGFVFFGCSSPAMTMPEAGDDGSMMTTDAGADSPSSNEAKKLIQALGDSKWHGTATRKGKMRGIELEFRSSSLQWAEIQNPYGPSRKRELRSFTVEPDGLTVKATANTPISWPDRTDTMGPIAFAVKVIDGMPRKLEVTPQGGTMETYTEGAFAKPTSGLTASARVFPTGAVEDAFCTSGGSGFDYTTFFNFARNKGGTELGHDLVAGAKLLAWVDATNQNKFSITDVDGINANGFTELSDTFNFFVRYTGTITHPGGSFRMRERDDVVEDGVWVFVDTKVNSANTNDLFLEVHGFIWADKTPDVPQANFGAGKIPIEIIVARCAKQISPMHVEISSNGVPFDLVGNVASEPEINDTLFPPAL